MSELNVSAQALKALYEAVDEGLRERFQRSLPFQDGVFDRWERARRLGFGEGASIYNSAFVYGEVSVGEQAWVGPNVILDGSGGGLAIGAYCQISANVLIFTHDTVHWALSGGALPRRAAPVVIGDRCYFGSGAVVAPGVDVGEACVIAANSFVNRDVPSRTIVGGVPARRLGVVVGEGADVELRYDERG